MTIYKLNKKNVMAGSVTGLLLIFIGVIFILYPEALIKYGFIRNSTTLKLIGVITIIFMLPLSAGMFTLIFSGYGLKITEEGFINNTNMTNVGVIHWRDIENIRIKKINNKNKIILITLRDEKKYYNKIKNPLKKLNVLIYNRTYKASFVIDPHKLFISSEEILYLLQNNQNRYSVE